MSTKQNADQYLYQDGKWIKAGRTMTVISDSPSPTPSGDTENKNIITRFKTSQLVGTDKETGDPKTLSQIVFTNTTGKTLYIVSDVETDDRPAIESTTKKHWVRRWLVNRKGERISPWDLKRRNKNWATGSIEIAPGEEVPLWKVLMIPLNVIQQYFNSDINENSIIYKTAYEDTPLDALDYNLNRYYSIAIPDTALSAKNNNYSTNRKHSSGILTHFFDRLFQTKKRARCVYIVERGEHENGQGWPCYYTKNVYLALNMKFTVRPNENGDISLQITFYDINNFDYNYLSKR